MDGRIFGERKQLQKLKHIYLNRAYMTIYNNSRKVSGCIGVYVELWMRLKYPLYGIFVKYYVE